MDISDRALQERMIALIRAFGLHHPDQTPCGTPVSIAEAHALMELAKQPALSQNALARQLHLQKSTVSRLVGILEERQWIVRSRNAVDGRVMDVALTEKGQTAAADLAIARQSKFGRVFTAIPESERTVVLHALEILVEAMDET